MGVDRKYYGVIPGDSWYSIAEKFNIDVNDLIQLNNAFYELDGVKRVRILLIGETIRIS